MHKKPLPLDRGVMARNRKEWHRFAEGAILARNRHDIADIDRVLGSSSDLLWK